MIGRVRSSGFLLELLVAIGTCCCGNVQAFIIPFSSFPSPPSGKLLSRPPYSSSSWKRESPSSSRRPPQPITPSYSSIAIANQKDEDGHGDESRPGKTGWPCYSRNARPWMKMVPIPLILSILHPKLEHNKYTPFLESWYRLYWPELLPRSSSLVWP